LEKVQKVVRAKESAACDGGDWNQSTMEPIAITESCLRTYCQATVERSLQAQRHNTVANVGHRVLQAAPGGKQLVDAQSSNARVRTFKEALLGRIAAHGDGVIHYTDDHSKWSADKRRGYTSKATIMHLGQRQRAPYSEDPRG
jgi:hypothetical protein